MDGTLIDTVWAEQLKKPVEQVIGIEILVNVHEIIQQRIHLVAVMNDKRIASVNPYRSIVTTQRMHRNGQYKVANHVLELLVLNLSRS